MRTSMTVGVALVASLALAAPASAEVRSGEVSDPDDMPATQLDIARVGASYDSSLGRLEVRLRLHAVYPSADGAANLVLRLGQTCRESDAVTVAINLFGDQFYGTVEVPGEDIIVNTGGEEGVTRGEYTYVYEHNALKGYDWRCASGIHTDAPRDTVADFALMGPSATPPGPTSATSAPTGEPVAPPPPASRPVAAPPSPQPLPPQPSTTVVASAVGGSRLAIRLARLGRRFVRVRVGCPSSRSGVLTLSSPRGSVRRAFRCRAGRVILLRLRAPRSVRRVRVSVAVGAERTSRVIGRRA